MANQTGGLMTQISTIDSVIGMSYVPKFQLWQTILSENPDGYIYIYSIGTYLKILPYKCVDIVDHVCAVDGELESLVTVSKS